MSYTFTYGSGTEQDPYQVWTAEDLDGVRDHQNAHFIQMDDIDLDGIDWQPIGDWSNHFAGKINFNFKTISNLYISATTVFNKGLGGLFAYINSGRIEGLNLINFTIGDIGQWFYWVGSISGYTENINIAKCYIADGSVKGTGWVGGMFGTFHGHFEQCGIRNVEVYGDEVVGGFAGQLLIDPDECAGGNSYAIGSIQESGDTTKTQWGGFAGAIQQTGSASSWTGNEEIENCYAVCELINPGGKSGGFAGDTAGPSGYPEPKATNCYWDDNVAGIGSSYHGEPRTTAQMVYPYTAKHASGTYVDWEFEEKHITDLTNFDFVFGDPPIWTHDVHHTINDGYPPFLSSLIVRGESIPFLFKVPYWE